ncbi:MAG: SCO family protein [Crocinitomicaceae bacterium]|nr:SCO family protein [Crocinitomicaceae bacterium]MDP5066081.1 SCO family protein [Crocinitomicaceae bacterium]
MKRILFLVVFFLILVPIGYYFLSDQKKVKPLPVINPIDVQQEMVDPEMLRMGKGHRIGAFRFENQDGIWISDADMKGKVSVVEYFFTTCKSICPIMNSQMQRIQRKFANTPDVRIFSLTVDPDTDTIAQMKRYATAHNAKAGQWHFLTGKKADLYGLARRSFFVLKPAEAQNLGDAGSDFIHTNNFVLVDQKLRIRGYYDGTNPKEVSLLQAHIEQLLNEPQ